MRVASWFGLLVLVGCGAQSPRPSGEPLRAGDAEASYAAYQAYCGTCSKAETCCLGPADFAAERWSSRSGTYLRAMRDYYECQRSEVLYQARYDSRPQAPLDNFGPLTEAGNTLASCYPRACGEYEEIMVAELDKALAKPSAHAPGALVSCSHSEAQ